MFVCPLKLSKGLASLGLYTVTWMLTRTQARLKDKDQGPKSKSRTLDLAGTYHAKETINLRGQVWLGFCTSMLFSSCVALFENLKNEDS